MAHGRIAVTGLGSGVLGPHLASIPVDPRSICLRAPEPVGLQIAAIRLPAMALALVLVHLRFHLRDL